MTFLPATDIKTGTYFIVFCSPGHLPEVVYGAMVCDGKGVWLNVPRCVMEEITSTAIPEVTTTSVMNMTLDPGKHRGVSLLYRDR